MGEKKFPEGIKIKSLDKLSWVVSGFGVRKPHENAPDFVKAKVSIQIENIKTFFRKFESSDNEWANLTVKEPYFEGRIDIEVAKFKSWVMDFVKNNPDKEWINLDICQSGEGRLYAGLDDWKPKPMAIEKESLPDFMS